MPVVAGASGRRRQAARASGQDRPRRSVPDAAAIPAASRVPGALFALVPREAAPALLLGPPRALHEPAAWIGPAAASLARLAEAEPRLPLLVAVETEALDLYHAQARIAVRQNVDPRRNRRDPCTLDGPEIGRRLEKAIPGASRTFAAPIRRLAADGASDRLVDLFLDAARATAVPCFPEPQSSTTTRGAAPPNGSCSERLKRCPQTTAACLRSTPGWDLRSEPAAQMEVDLAAQGLAGGRDRRLLPFPNADDYRRDRRKDFELQKHGLPRRPSPRRRRRAGLKMCSTRSWPQSQAGAAIIPGACSMNPSSELTLVDRVGAGATARRG